MCQKGNLPAWNICDERVVPRGWYVSNIEGLHSSLPPGLSLPNISYLPRQVLLIPSIQLTDSFPHLLTFTANPVRSTYCKHFEVQRYCSAPRNLLVHLTLHALVPCEASVLR